MFNSVNLFSADATIYMWIIVAVLVIFMFIMPIFTNRKRSKEVNEMFDSLSVGDEIMTLGGVMGKVIELKTHESGEKLMVIETGEGANKTTMTFTIQALRLNYTKTKLRQEQLAKAKAEKEAQKNGTALPLEPVEKDEPKETIKEVQQEASQEVKTETEQPEQSEQVVEQEVIQEKSDDQ